jgi:hypothetical protein
MDRENEEPPKTLSIPEAGWQYFRLGRNASYEAAKRGDIPVIPIGVKKKRVPVVLMEQKLLEAGNDKATNEHSHRMCVSSRRFTGEK